MAVGRSNDLQKYCLDLAQRAQTGRRRTGHVTRRPESSTGSAAAAKLLGERSVALAEANRLDLAAAPGFGLTDAADRPPAADARRIVERWPRRWKRWPRCPSRSARSSESSIRPNGLEVQKVRVPLGVIFFIYESRPNVTADAAALCVKSGNAVILRGGKEAAHSNAAIVEILAEAAADVGPARRRRATGRHDRPRGGGPPARACPSTSTVAIPRGGESLIRRVTRRGPDAGHQALRRQLPRVSRPRRPTRTWPSGSWSTPSASGWACATRPSRWWSTPTWPTTLLPRIGKALIDRGIEIRGDAATRDDCCPQAKPATEEDYCDRVPRADHLGEGGRFAGRGDRAHQPLQFAAHRGDRHRATSPPPGSSPPRSTARR